MRSQTTDYEFIRELFLRRGFCCWFLCALGMRLAVRTFPNLTAPGALVAFAHLSSLPSKILNPILPQSSKRAQKRTNELVWMSLGRDRSSFVGILGRGQFHWRAVQLLIVKKRRTKSHGKIIFPSAVTEGEHQPNLESKCGQVVEISKDRGVTVLAVFVAQDATEGAIRSAGRRGETQIEKISGKRPVLMPAVNARVARAIAQRQIRLEIAHSPNVRGGVFRAARQKTMLRVFEILVFGLQNDAN